MGRVLAELSHSLREIALVLKVSNREVTYLPEAGGLRLGDDLTS